MKTIAISSVAQETLAGSRYRAWLPKGEYQIMVPRLKYYTSVTANSVAGICILACTTAGPRRLTQIVVTYTASAGVGNRYIKMQLMTDSGVYTVLTNTVITASMVRELVTSVDAETYSRVTGTLNIESMKIPSGDAVSTVIIEDILAFDPNDTIIALAGIAGNLEYISMWVGGNERKLGEGMTHRVVIETDSYVEFDLAQGSADIVAGFISPSAFAEDLVIHGDGI